MGCLFSKRRSDNTNLEDIVPQSPQQGKENLDSRQSQDLMRLIELKLKIKQYVYDCEISRLYDMAVDEPPSYGPVLDKFREIQEECNKMEKRWIKYDDLESTTIVSGCHLLYRKIDDALVEFDLGEEPLISEV